MRLLATPLGPVLGHFWSNPKRGPFAKLIPKKDKSFQNLESVHPVVRGGVIFFFAQKCVKNVPPHSGEGTFLFLFVLIQKMQFVYLSWGGGGGLLSCQFETCKELLDTPRNHILPFFFFGGGEDG